MPDDETQESPATEETEEVEQQEETGEDAGEDALQDAGKKALDAMKAKWHKERDNRKELERQIAELKAAQQLKEGEQPDPGALKREAQAEADRRANERILRAEIRAAAAGKLADPADALRLLDLSAFEVDSDGNIDSDEISEAINGLLEKKPYLSAQGGKRFQGTADSGARKSTGPKQLTQDDVDALMRAGKPEEVVKAKKEGRLNDLLGITSR